MWPGIASQANGAEASGPTANPRIDSNGWLLRLAQIHAPHKTSGSRSPRPARLWSLGSESPSPLEMVPENGGTSLLLPPVPVYAGIELFRKPG